MARPRTEQDIIKILRDATTKAGGVRAFAREQSFAAGFISNVLNGREIMTDRLAEALGYEREIIMRFRPKASKQLQD